MKATLYGFFFLASGKSIEQIFYRQYICTLWNIKNNYFVNMIDFFLIFGVLTPLSAIFQLYHGDQF